MKKEKQSPRRRLWWILREANLSGLRVPEGPLHHKNRFSMPPHTPRFWCKENQELWGACFYHMCIATMLACSTFWMLTKDIKLVVKELSSSLHQGCAEYQPLDQLLSCHRPRQRWPSNTCVYMGWGDKKGTRSLDIVSSVMGGQHAWTLSQRKTYFLY